MGICIYGVTLEKLSFDSLESPDTVLLMPFVTHKSFQKSLKNNEIFFYTDSKGVDSGPFLSMTYSNFHDLKNKLCFKLYKMNLNVLFDKIQQDLPSKKYSCPFYHFFNFSESEGFIGPSAVKEMAKALENKKFKTKFLRKIDKNDSDDYDYWTEVLYKIITETAKVDGYLKFC